MSQTATRRLFLSSAPFALAAVALPLAAETHLGAMSSAGPAEPCRLLSAEDLKTKTAALEAHPGNDNLFTSTTLPLAVVLTTEEHKSAAEFEWHEGRDHIVQIMAGKTQYEVGGRPEHAHSTKPGEWLAPEASGIIVYTLQPGDMLIIPRGTPHRRKTESRVTFLLISTTGNVPSSSALPS